MAADAVLGDSPERPIGETQETLGHEVADKVWVTHDEVEELLAMAQDTSGVEIDDSDLIETRFLGDPEDESSFAIGFFRPTSLITLEQVRGHYDIMRIDRLGRSVGQRQLQNCGVAYQDAEHAERYIHDANRFFGTEYSIDDFEPDINGRYPIVVFGHNRDFAIRANNVRVNGHQDVGTDVFASVYPNIAFHEAIEMQFTENTGEPPAHYERAYSIKAYIESVAASNGGLPDHRVATNLNMSIGQIKEALIYVDLPESLRGLVEVPEGGLNFSAALAFAQLEGVSTEEEIQMYAQKALDNSYSNKKVYEMVREVRAVELLPMGVRRMMQDKLITFEQALTLRKLNGVIDDEKICELAENGCAHGWELEDYRRRADTAYNNAMFKMEGLFDELLDQGDAVHSEGVQGRRLNIARGHLSTALKGIEAYVGTFAMLVREVADLPSGVLDDDTQRTIERGLKQMEKIAERLSNVEDAVTAGDDEAMRERYEALRQILGELLRPDDDRKRQADISQTPML